MYFNPAEINQWKVRIKYYCMMWSANQNLAAISMFVAVFLQHWWKKSSSDCFVFIFSMPSKLTKIRVQFIFLGITIFCALSFSELILTFNSKNLGLKWDWISWSKTYLCLWTSLYCLLTLIAISNPKWQQLSWFLFLLCTVKFQPSGSLVLLVVKFHSPQGSLERLLTPLAPPFQPCSCPFGKGGPFLTEICYHFRVLIEVSQVRLVLIIIIVTSHMHSECHMFLSEEFVTKSQNVYICGTGSSAPGKKWVRNTW